MIRFWALGQTFPASLGCDCTKACKRLGGSSLSQKGPDQTMVLRRGFRIELDEPVLVVEDAVTTGASVTKVIEAVEGMGGRVMAVAALVDRTGGQSPWAIPLLSVVSVAIPSWIPSQCPLCASEVALIRPKA